MPDKASMEPRTPRRRDINTVNRRRRLEEPQQQIVANEDSRNAEEALRVYLSYSRNRHAPYDARLAALGPDTYRIFRGWQLNRNTRLYNRILPLTEQPEVIAQIYGIDPSRTSRFRMAMYGAEILEEIVDDGYPLDRMRELRNLANPDSESTRLFDRLERDDPLMGLAV